MGHRTKELVGGLKGALLISASLFALIPQFTGLTSVGVELAPGFAALSISIGFALAVGGGYVIAASAGRKTARRTIVVASLALISSILLMVLLAGRESSEFQIARTVTVSLGVLLGGYLRTPQPQRRVRLVALPDQELRIHLEKRIASSHEYSRHLITNLVNWYAFFVTVNYASMGWFAVQRERGASNETSSLIILIASVFVLQNVLGMLACARVKRHILAVSDEVVGYEQSLVGEQLDSEAREVLMPSSVYSRAIQLMSFGLVAIALAWTALPFFIAGNIAADLGARILSWWGA
jgi:hypothetical protein